MYRRRPRLVMSMVALCGLVIGCSSSDNGRVAELEGQLDMEKAARMTAEQERDTAKAGQAAAEAAQMAAEQAQDAAEAARRMAEQERDAAKAAQMTAEQSQAAAEAAQMAAKQAQAAAETAQMTAEQERDAAQAAQMIAEQAQAAAEAARMAAEQAQAAAETARTMAGQERDSAKTAQMMAEQSQAAAEAARMTAEQERDAAKAAQMTAEQAQAAAEAARMAAEQAQMAAEVAQMTSEQEREDARTAQMMAEQAQAAAEAAQMAAEQARATAEAARMTAEQTLADREYDAAVASAVERVTAWNRRFETHPEGGPPRGTSGWISNTEAYANVGSDFAAVSQTHADGDNIVMAVPWHDENGVLQFYVTSDPVRSPLHEVGVYPGSGIWTEGPDVEGLTTSYEPIPSHGLGDDWKGFVLMKAYDGHGTRRVRLFADFGESDVLVRPDDEERIGRDGYGRQILLSDERMPDNPSGPPGSDWVYIILPEDGLQGTVDGVAGTFTCAGVYCSLLTSIDGSGYTPWTDSAAVRFTPADGSGEVMLDPVRVVRPSTEVPKVNYLVFGSWEDIPEDMTDVDGYDFGLFAGGDDPFMASNLPALAGTATYAGKAAGTYVETIRPRTDSFAADVDLMADFGSEGDLGRVTGEVSNFQLASGNPMPVNSLRLETTWDWENELWAPNNIRTSWDDGNSIPGGFIEGQTIADGGWQGLWGGKFFGNGAASASHPASLAGTFGATDGTRSIAGSFGAHKQ